MVKLAKQQRRLIQHYSTDIQERYKPQVDKLAL